MRYLINGFFCIHTINIVHCLSYKKCPTDLIHNSQFDFTTVRASKKVGSFQPRPRPSSFIYI